MKSSAAHSLLDFIKQQMHFEYLSDLCFLQPVQYPTLRIIISHIPPNDYSVQDWNDALHYFEQPSNQIHTVAEAKECLLRHFE